MRLFIKIVILHGVFALFISPSKASEKLTLGNITKARNHFQDKLNNGIPFGGSSIDFKIPTGELVSNVDIRLLAKWLYSKDSLPSLEEISLSMDSENTATRVFCFECLNLIFKRNINFNPYFPPGYQNEEIANIRTMINEVRTIKEPIDKVSPK